MISLDIKNRKNMDKVLHFPKEGSIIQTDKKGIHGATLIQQ